MPEPKPIIKTSEFRIVKDRGTYDVEIFLPNVKLGEWLKLYITTDITSGLPGSSVERIEYLKGDPESPWGKSRILHGFKIGENLPFIFNTDARQTVWDYGNGNGQILVTPLNGFFGGYISVHLQETSVNDTPGVLGKFNLEHMDVKLCSYMHTATGLSEEIIQCIPLLRTFDHLPSKTLDIAGYIPLMLIAYMLTSFALKMPPALFGINQKSFK